jgi:hypothetical protein
MQVSDNNSGINADIINTWFVNTFLNYREEGPSRLRNMSTTILPFSTVPNMGSRKTGIREMLRKNCIESYPNYSSPREDAFARSGSKLNRSSCNQIISL